MSRYVADLHLVTGRVAGAGFYFLNGFARKNTAIMHSCLLIFGQSSELINLDIEFSGHGVGLSCWGLLCCFHLK